MEGYIDFIRKKLIKIIKLKISINNMSKESDKLNDTWNWIIKDSCLVGSSPNLKHQPLIASFDMDDTIITRKSGAKFPKDAHDWVLLLDKVTPTIKKLDENGYKIVIFTNQLGIEKGKTKP